MQAYGLIIAVFVNICCRELNRQAQAKGVGGEAAGELGSKAHLFKETFFFF